MKTIIITFFITSSWVFSQEPLSCYGDIIQDVFRNRIIENKTLIELEECICNESKLPILIPKESIEDGVEMITFYTPGKRKNCLVEHFKKTKQEVLGYDFKFNRDSIINVISNNISINTREFTVDRFFENQDVSNLCYKSDNYYKTMSYSYVLFKAGILTFINDIDGSLRYVPY